MVDKVILAGCCTHSLTRLSRAGAQHQAQQACYPGDVSGQPAASRQDHTAQEDWSDAAGEAPATGLQDFRALSRIRVKSATEEFL